MNALNSIFFTMIGIFSVAAHSSSQPDSFSKKMVTTTYKVASEAWESSKIIVGTLASLTAFNAGIHVLNSYTNPKRFAYWVENPRNAGYSFPDGSFKNYPSLAPLAFGAQDSLIPGIGYGLLFALASRINKDNKYTIKDLATPVAIALGTELLCNTYLPQHTINLFLLNWGIRYTTAFTVATYL